MRPYPIPPLGKKVGIQGRDGRTLPEWLRPKIIAIEAGHMTPRLFKDEAAGSVVPQLLSPVQIQVEAARGGVTPFKGARSVVALGRERPRCGANRVCKFRAESL